MILYKKKLQVFISSTYKNLRNERQAAVQAILEAGHIPAGMELFVAEDESQMNVIKYWIESSDLFVLILGTRYGSIASGNTKSYVEREFEHALKKRRPVIRIILSDEKMQSLPRSTVKSRDYKLLTKFRMKVKKRMAWFYDDAKDIKMALHRTLADYAQDPKLVGWIRADHSAKFEDLVKEIAELKDKIKPPKMKREGQNSVLSQKQEEAKNKEKEWLKLVETLNQTMLTIPKNLLGTNKEKSISLLNILLLWESSFALGVENNINITPQHEFLFYKVAPKLLVFDLVEDVKIAGAQWRRIKLSKYGRKFLASWNRRTAISNIQKTQKKPAQKRAALTKSQKR